MKIFIAVLGLILSTSAQASETSTALITQADLDSITRLLRADTLHVRLDGRAGELVPPAPLRYLGVPAQNFELDLDWILRLANLKFRDIRATNTTVNLLTDHIELRVHFEDHGVELTSIVGSLDLAGISAVVTLTFDAEARIILRDARLETSSIRGTGLLKSGEVIRRARELADRVIRDQMELILRTPAAREDVARAMLEWARIQSATSWSRLVHGSARIESGLVAFGVERE